MKKEIITDIIPAWGGPAVKSLTLGRYEPEPISVGDAPVLVQNKAKLLAFEVALVGTKYLLTEDQELEHLLARLAPYAELQVLHEPTNTHDPYALAVYFDSKKIGYIPKGWNRKIIDGAKHGVRFNFFLSQMVGVEEIRNHGGNPRLLVVPTG